MRDRALRAVGAADATWPQRRAELTALGALRDSPIPADLAGWAADLADPGAPVGSGTPLLGTPLVAQPFPGLLWNGARAHRAGLGFAERLVLLALVCGGPTLDARLMSRAVAAGLAAAKDLSPAVEAPASEPIAVLSAGTVAAAVTAAVAAGADPGRLDEAIELAGSLMLIGRPGLADPVRDGIWAGHEIAVGWLAAVVLPDAGIRATADSLDTTLSTIGEPTIVAPVDRTPSAAVARDALGDSDPGEVDAAQMWALLR